MRRIIHVDMNAFFASCHQAEDPSLRGKPVLVAGDPQKRHGIILTASYEARQFGVKTAMPVFEAKKRCPHGIFVRPRHRLYLDYSRRVFQILCDYTPLVEPFSIDEAWLDVTGCGRLFGTAENIAKTLQQRIKSELSLTCSVGISENKFLAKMASEMQKPSGFTILEAGDVPAVLWPLPVGEMVGVGRKLASAFKELGVVTIGDLAKLPVKLLVSRLGVMGETLHHLAHGRDDSPVDPGAYDTAKSVGHSVTLPRDINKIEEVERVLLDLSEKVGRRMREGGYQCKTVTLTVKDHNFVTVTRSVTLREPTCLTDVIYRSACTLYKTRFEPWRKVRLLGVSVSNLAPREHGYQLTLFGAEDRERADRLTRAVDSIKDRYGDSAMLRATLSEGPARTKS